MKMIKLNMYGRGFKLRAAITIACQMAFILFGKFMLKTPVRNIQLTPSLGYDQGVFSGIVGNENWLDTFGHPSAGLEGIIVSIYNLGCFTGTILAFLFCEKTGRRLAMWIAMGWIIVGAVLQCSSYSVAQLMVARFITGIGKCRSASHIGNKRLSEIQERELRHQPYQCTSPNSVKPSIAAALWPLNLSSSALVSKSRTGSTSECPTPEEK